MKLEEIIEVIEVKMHIGYVDYLICQLQVYDVHVNCNNHNLASLHNISITKTEYKKIFGLNLYTKHNILREYYVIDLPKDVEAYEKTLMDNLSLYTKDFKTYEEYKEWFKNDRT